MKDFLWHVKANFYRSLRKCFPFNLILKGENKKLETLLKSIDTKEKIILDLGTGTGNTLQFLDDTNVVFAIDSNFSMLQITQRLIPSAILIQADALKLPIKSNTIHIITAVGLSEYVRNIESLLKEISRALRENSFLIMTFSPKGVWTRLRLVLGHAIFPSSLNEIERIARKEKFQKLINNRSLMQEQLLFKHIN